jgi:hypothetical protein
VEPGAGAALAARMVSQGRALWGAVSRKDILLPTIFVFLWQVRFSPNLGACNFCACPDWLQRDRPASLMPAVDGACAYVCVCRCVCVCGCACAGVHVSGGCHRKCPAHQRG